MIYMFNLIRKAMVIAKFTENLSIVEMKYQTFERMLKARPPQAKRSPNHIDHRTDHKTEGRSQAKQSLNH